MISPPAPAWAIPPGWTREADPARIRRVSALEVGRGPAAPVGKRRVRQLAITPAPPQSIENAVLLVFGSSVRSSPPQEFSAKVVASPRTNILSPSRPSPAPLGRAAPRQQAQGLLRSLLRYF